MEGDRFLYLSRWYIPVIRELAQSPAFQPAPAWIARQLRPPITADEAEQALSVLSSLGMRVEDEDGRLLQAEGAVVTPREVSPKKPLPVFYQRNDTTWP